MASRNTGGLAFPRPGVKNGYGNVEGAADGMTLRDYFAAKAMVGLLSEPQPEDGEPELGEGREYAAKAAKAAYRIADAMLAERSK
jgi:hypothetical protein